MKTKWQAQPLSLSSDSGRSRTGVTTDAIRFNHVRICLNEETIGLVADVLKNWSYVQLKEQLIPRLSVSEEAKLNHLLNELSLGNRTPSQLLREMKQLGGDTVGSELLKALWLQRFPESGRTIFACVDSGCKIHEVYTRPVIAELSKDTRQEVKDFKTMVTSFADAVSKLATTDCKYFAFRS